jgi:hypothetical protein
MRSLQNQTAQSTVQKQKNKRVCPSKTLLETNSLVPSFAAPLRTPCTAQRPLLACSDSSVSTRFNHKRQAAMRRCMTGYTVTRYKRMEQMDTEDSAQTLRKVDCRLPGLFDPRNHPLAQHIPDNLYHQHHRCQNLKPYTP